MPNPYATGATYLLQQKVSGAGVFDGTSAGYPMYTYVAGPISFRVRWHEIGTDGNSRQIALVDAGAGRPVPATRVTYDPETKLLHVLLRRSNVAITATAAEVVAAINEYMPSQPTISRVSRYFKAGLITDGVIPAGVAPTFFTGGLVPDWLQGTTKLVLPGGANGGLFYFDQDGPWMIRSVVGKFSAPVAVTLKVANVTKDLRVIADEQFTIYTSPAPTAEFSFSDIQHPLMPDQAVLVLGAANGVAQVAGRAEAGLPML